MSTVAFGALSMVVALQFQSVFDIWLSFYGIWLAKVLIPLIASVYDKIIPSKYFVFLVIIGLFSLFLYSKLQLFSIDALAPTFIPSVILFTLLYNLTKTHNRTKKQSL